MSPGTSTMDAAPMAVQWRTGWPSVSKPLSAGKSLASRPQSLVE